MKKINCITNFHPDCRRGMPDSVDPSCRWQNWPAVVTGTSGERRWCRMPCLEIKIKVCQKNYGKGGQTFLLASQIWEPIYKHQVFNVHLSYLPGQKQIFKLWNEISNLQRLPFFQLIIRKFCLMVCNRGGSCSKAKFETFSYKTVLFLIVVTMNVVTI